ncbi:protein of unknown function DUF354 [Caldithrix abyssi DSM 13497]|uniref:DUF354 domain-containing protein n=1 Tax=Caldithrix abyssi DSM 13497 TaxID=880073 RepID=H1XRP5_CALAY|nr:DUF354 domain-containing protein [Caldithrix abyssi]APF20137.1 hypothetical protein Cabys_3389 [Caldithrix abyssi DSM 13497]EHO40198.1 protein of unknown function DUF354 [Caldithrix abyssi DSM 13497]
MKILIDIGHPAHVHLFKHFAWQMQNKGHEIFFTCREKEFEIYLLRKYGFKFKSFGKKYVSTLGKLLGLIEFDIKEIISGIKFKPDIFLSHGSIYAAHAAFLLRKPHIALEDTGNWEQVRLYLPFTEVILTSDVFPIDYGKNKQIRYMGHHELTYLHPNYFQKDESFFKMLNIAKNEKFVLLRLVAWNATHDIGQKGISKNSLREIIKLLERKYRVFISTESNLNENFKKYKISFPPDRMHQALYYADLFIGEGTTMSMEAAILGTPSIYVNSLQYSNVKDMEKYGLIYNFKSTEGLLNKIKEIMSDENIKLEWQKRRERMLKDKIDVTAFLVWFVENYPESARIMREEPEYQYRFK